VTAPALVSVAADGVIDHVNGRRAAVIAVDSLKKSFAYGSDAGDFTRFKKAVEDTLPKIRRDVEDYVSAGRFPALFIAVARMLGEQAYFYVKGDIRIYSYNIREKKIKRIEGADLTEAYKVSRGESFAVASRGVYEALSDTELLSCLIRKNSGIFAKQERVYEKALRAIEKVNGKNIKYAKNATIVLIEAASSRKRN
jgi:serine/threonine protein phosphatase PrpC